MKYASTALIAYLASGAPFLMADLYTLTPQGGSPVYWTAADTDLVMGGITYTTSHEAGTQPVLERGTIRTAHGTETQTMDLTLYPGQTGQWGGVALPLAVANGALDMARVRVDRVFMPTWGDTTTLGALELFEGNVAGVDPGSQKIVLHVKSDLEKLGFKWPRILFLDRCPNVFCDAACGLARSAYTTTGALSGGDQNTIETSLSPVANFYAGGLLVMTSGVCAGSRRTIASNPGNTTGTPGAVVLAVPLPAVPAVGDTYQISQGCDREPATCASYSNSGNYRGCPYIPVAETAR